MTREDEINNASYAYWVDNYANIEFIDEEEKELHSRDIQDSFINGAEWADSHPRWISVEDELPEVGVAVLTTTLHGTQRVGFYEDGWWLANSPDLVRMGSITHWMPLPQAQKKGGEQ